MFEQRWPIATTVAPSTGCSIIIIILFFRVNIVHWLHCINMAIHTRPNLGATHCQRSDTNHTWKHRNLLRRIACGELPVFRKKTKDNRTQKAVQRYGMGKLLCEKCLRDVWCRNESVRVGEQRRPIVTTVAPSTGCSIIIIIIFSYEHCTLIALYKYGDTYAPKPRGNSLPAIRYEPRMKTSQSFNCLRRMACFS